MRADKYIFESGRAKSREAAQKLIKNGNVIIDGKCISKPSFEIDSETEHKIELTGETLKYVSRGGLKLEKALSEFAIDVTGLDAIDIGASTGGFTDCLLQNGIGSVLCIDVGTSQLDKSIENDPRVTSLEKVNARYLTEETTGRLFDIAVCDVSFISLTLIMPSVNRILKPDGIFIALIKPQFEAGRKNIGKGGIVKDKKVHREVINKVTECGRENSLYISALTESPIQGGDGNTEYLALFTKNNRERTCRSFEENRNLSEC